MDGILIVGVLLLISYAIVHAKTTATKYGKIYVPKKHPIRRSCPICSHEVELVYSVRCPKCGSLIL